MALFGFGRGSSSLSTDSRKFLAQYKRHRPIRLRLNDKLAAGIPPDVLEEGADKLGMLRGDVFVFNDENEMGVLADYCIYDVYRQGCNAIEQYLCHDPPDADSDEMAILQAMQHATFAVIAVRSVEPGVGCHIHNLFADESRLLVDVGFSKSAMRGAVVATRLLDFGGYVATSGAALPMGILDDEELDRWRRQFSTAPHDEHFDPAPLIRACLENGSASMIHYAGSGARPDMASGGDFLAAAPRGPRRRSSAKGSSRKPGPNRRCRCGSGKMFKNCCGKTSRP